MTLEVIKSDHIGVQFTMPYDQSVNKLPGNEDATLRTGEQIEVVSCVRERLIPANEAYAMWIIVKRPESDTLFALTNEEYSGVFNASNKLKA